MASRLPTVFILLTVVVNAMGIGLIIPVMPDLILEVQGGSLARAAVWGGVLSTGFAIMQFLCGPAIGSLSDAFGRRPILLVSLAITAADYLVLAFANHVWILLLARVIGGAAAATQSTAAAYMADTSEPDKRGPGFALVSAAFGLGFVVGPLFGGVLGEYGTRAPFYAAAVLSGMSFLFGWFILPESVSSENRRPFSLHRANPLAALKTARKLPGLGRLLTVLFLYQIAFNVYPSVWAYFTQAQFGWDTRLIGVSLAIFGLSMALVQGALTRVFLNKLGYARTVGMGFGFALLSYALLAGLKNGMAALILIPIAAFASMAIPALQAIMSRRTGEDAQGELQGVFSSVNALAFIASPMMMTGVFAAFTKNDATIYLPGAPFIASFILAALGFILFVTRRRTGQTRPSP